MKLFHSYDRKKVAPFGRGIGLASLRLGLLEEKLKNLSDVSLSEDKKKQMRAHIVQTVSQRAQAAESGFEGLIVKLKEFAAQIMPDQSFRRLLKEKFYMLAEFEQNRFGRRFWNGLFRTRVYAGVIAAVFIFTVLFNFTFRIERAEAAVVTVVESAEGEVVVLRQGQALRASAGFLLKADDVVRTGMASKVVIRFLDQSISRLDENTEVKISRLFVNPANRTQTVVELVLNRGRLWSRVINLIDNVSRFQVQADNTLAVAKRKAAFNVSVQPKKNATVSAIQNRVDLVVATDKKVVETTLMKGFAAEMKAESAQAPKITKEKTPEAKDEWVKENLEEDKIYIETVKQEVEQEFRDQISTEPGSALRAVKDISQGVKIALTFDKLDRQKKMLIKVEEKLGEAQLLLAKGRFDEAQGSLNEFKEVLKGIFDWLKEFEVLNPAEAQEFRVQIREVIGTYEKKLAVILPNEPLYTLKTVVADTKVLVADGSLEKTEEKLAQAGDKLLDAHALVEQGENEKALEQVEAYKGAISDVVEEVNQLPEGEKEKAVSAFLDNRVEDLKALQAMTEEQKSKPVLEKTPEAAFSSEEIPEVPLPPEAAVPGIEESQPKEVDVSAALQESKELNQKVEDTKQETLTQLGEAVLQAQQEQPSIQVLQKLQEIKNTDVNGKKFMNFTLTKDKVTIQLLTPPPTGAIETPKLLPAQP